MTSVQPQYLSSVHEDEKANSNYDTMEKLRAGPLLSDSEPEKTLYNNEQKKGKTQSQSSKLLRNTKDLRTINDSPLTKSLKRDTFQKDPGFLMTNKSTPKKHWPSERSPIKYTEAYRNLLESDVYGKSVKEIEAENYALRKALKDMNEELQRAVEKVKMVDLVGKRQEFRDKNPEDKLRTIIRELANNEQIIAINEEEVRKVEARIEGIKDGDYLYKVQQEIRDIKKQTEKIHKENKKLEIKNDETGKNLDILENVKGNPSSVEEIHAKQDELMSLKEKIIELKKKNQSKLEEKESKQEKEKKFTEELKKLGKRVQPHSEIPQHMEKAYLQYSILSKQIKILENQLNYTENKNKKFLITQKERELEELYLNNQKERNHFQRLDDIISEQVTALRNIAQLEVRTSNKTVQEIVRSMKSNLDREEKKREITAQSHEEVANEIDKDYQALSLRKEKNLKIGLKVKGEMYSGLPLYSPGLKFRSVTTNNRNVVKRELVENRKKPMWKENKGGYEGMGSHLLKTNQHNENNNNKLYSKPLGLKKSRVAQETKRDENELSYGQSTGRSNYDKHDASKPKNSERNSHRGPQGIVKENYEQKNEEAQKEGSLELTRKAKMPLNLNINRKESDKNNEKEDILKSGNISENDNENKVNQTKKLPRENKNRSESPSPLRSSRKSSPGKRSDLEIDVEAIEREHEGVFDFNHGSNKKPQSTGKESEERTQEKNRTMNQKKKFEKTEPERQEENGDHNKTDNEIKQSTNRSERNMELQGKSVLKKNDEDFEEFEFDK